MLVLALCAAERRVDARIARARFLEAYPGSVHAERVRAACTEP
jgi:hypothetical protein